MPVFSPVGYMIKGRNASASLTGMGDDDMYEDRKHVKISFSEISFNKSSYTLSYKVNSSGFSSNSVSIIFEMNRDKNGKNIGWHTYDMKTNMTVTNGYRGSVSMSKIITKNPDLAAEINASGQKIYLILFTGTEIAEQIKL